jgi:glutaredoxin 3
MTKTAKIEVYIKDYCPYCTKAKLLLDQLGLGYTTHDITHNPEGYAEIQARRPGARTVPQIFIDGTGIGGCDDLYALHAAGGLLPLVQA